MAKYAIINGVRVKLEQAIALEESAQPREGRLYQALKNCQGRLRLLDSEGTELLNTREALLVEIATDFPHLIEKAKQSALFAGDLECLEDALEEGDHAREDAPGSENLTPGYSEGFVPSLEGSEDAPSNDWADMSREELMAECDAAGISYKKNSPTARLIEWLKKGSSKVEL